jgi:integrase
MPSTKVTVRPQWANGVHYFRVRYWEGGKSHKRFFHTEAEAEAEAKHLRSQIQRAGDVWLSLTAQERNHLLCAWEDSKRLGIDIREAVQSASQRGNGHTSMSIGKVINDLKAAKLNHGNNAGYVTNLGIVLDQFAKGKEALAIDRITLADVERFLDSKSLAYRSTVRGRLSTMFNFAVRRGYRIDNPCNRLERIKVTKQPPAVFTVEQFKLVVAWLTANQPAGLAWFALSTLCGLRPEEAEKTTRRDINFEEGYIKVEAQTSKVRQRRIVYPKTEAVAFLKRALKIGTLPYSKEARRRMIGWSGHTDGLRGALGFAVWPKDITRHTAASYWLASEASAIYVSAMLGNSERVLGSHYKAIVTKAEAVEFWKVVEEFAK